MEQQLILEEPDSQSEKHWKEKVALKNESGYSEKWKWLLWTVKVTSVKSESDFCEKEKVISVKNRKWWQTQLLEKQLILKKPDSWQKGEW